MPDSRTPDGQQPGDAPTSSAALLLECRRKYKKVLEEARGLKAVVDLSRSVSSHLDIAEILESAMQAAVVLTGAERGYLVLLDEAGVPKVEASYRIDVEAMSGEDLSFSQSIVRHTVETAKPMLSTDAQEDERFAAAASVRMMDVRAVMAAPILDESGKPMGAVYVDDPLAAGKFSERLLGLLQGFADQVSVAITNAHNVERRLRDQRRQQQMIVAQAVQKSLLPKKPPQAVWLETAWGYESAHDVGGDLIMFPTLTDGSQALFVADVAGKGVPAALIMTKIHEAAKQSALRTDDPVTFLSNINTSFKEDFDIGSMVTAMIVVFGPDGSSVRVARAGHLPLGVVRPATGKLEWHEPRGIALGLAGEPVFSSVLDVLELAIGEDDGVLLLTDGITEAMSVDRDEFGFDRIVRCVEARARAGPREVIDALLVDVRSFCVGTQQSDDIAVVYAKRRVRTSG
jgi:sigma-B regulation protein RsbU (phosphoserine phosphatase)